MTADDDALEFQDQSPTYQSDRWKTLQQEDLHDSSVILAEESPLADADDHAADFAGQDSGLGIVEESPLADVDDHAPDLRDSGVGIVLKDSALDYDPSSDPEPPRPKSKPKPVRAEARPAPRTPSQPPPALPPRRIAVRPKDEHHKRPGVAVCPACQAKNAFQARVCARCNADIPAPDEANDDRKVNHAGILKGQFQPKNRGPVDAELIPEHVRAQWDADKQAQQARLDGRKKHRKQVAKELAIASAVGFVVASVLLSAGLPWWLRLFTIIIDGAIGVGSAYAVFHTGAGRLQAAGIYGGAAFVTHTFKLLLVMGVASAPIGIAFFLMWVGILGLSAILGFGAGMNLEFRRFDQEI